MNALANLISTAARQFGAREAVVGADRTLTFAGVDAESNRLASYLARERGLAKGERVAILLDNCPEFVVADFALIKAGLIRVPVNPRYAAPEIEFILRHSGAAALITSASFEPAIAPLRDRCRPAVRHRCRPCARSVVAARVDRMARSARCGFAGCVRRRHRRRRRLHDRIHIRHDRPAEGRADDASARAGRTSATATRTRCS